MCCLVYLGVMVANWSVGTEIDRMVRIPLGLCAVCDYGF